MKTYLNYIAYQIKKDKDDILLTLWFMLSFAMIFVGFVIGFYFVTPIPFIISLIGIIINPPIILKILVCFGEEYDRYQKWKSTSSNVKGETNE